MGCDVKGEVPASVDPQSYLLVTVLGENVKLVLDHQLHFGRVKSFYYVLDSLKIPDICWSLRLAVFTYFTILENPSAVYFVLAMPSTMLLYFLLTLHLGTRSFHRGYRGSWRGPR